MDQSGQPLFENNCAILQAVGYGEDARERFYTIDHTRQTITLGVRQDKGFVVVRKKGQDVAAVTLSTTYDDLPGFPPRKYSQQRAGPFRILRRVNDLAYELDLPKKRQAFLQFAELRLRGIVVPVMMETLSVLLMICIQHGTKVCVKSMESAIRDNELRYEVKLQAETGGDNVQFMLDVGWPALFATPQPITTFISEVWPVCQKVVLASADETKSNPLGRGSEGIIPLVGQLWTDGHVRRRQSLTTTQIQSEQTNQSIEIALRHHIFVSDIPWTNVVPALQQDTNNSISAATTHAPNEVVFGFRPLTKVDWMSDQSLTTTQIR